MLDWIENHGEAFLSKHTGVGKSLHRARALQKRHEDFEEVAQVGATIGNILGIHMKKVMAGYPARRPCFQAVVFATSLKQIRRCNWLQTLQVESMGALQDLTFNLSFLFLLHLSPQCSSPSSFLSPLMKVPLSFTSLPSCFSSSLFTLSNGTYL